MVSFAFTLSITRRSHPNTSHPPPYFETTQQTERYFKLKKTYTTPPQTNPATPKHKPQRRGSGCPPLPTSTSSSSSQTALIPSFKHQLSVRPRLKMSDASQNDMGTVERRMSYGRGGAGNIRRQSEIPFGQRVKADGTPRRRSSVFSSMSSSHDGKRRFSWFGLRKGGVEEARFVEVDLIERE
ncbi:hypothetical protein GLAREA_04643 [Glarea lozoyensis ATCC 20868]|uniref:Uncharacterized protein n=1 Tax=Glarea lozoyensis (strain ATCC 20868 / MF5171) TaxID=1116229 RepID=S3CN13_GLAL2|nr:uncharacterized protein GLAREA_04643 [Glarea lozoyensis ATCC 20868]EPE27852.1 hypothetical protein GLAREA_04643 [Glarea lozoyensis ATCC 20868]